MPKKTIIYLHGFNSASLDLHGNLLTGKDKLRVMQAFCAEKGIVFHSPNVDYRDFENLIEDRLFEWNQFLDQGHEVIFMGSSMGGFASDYLAMKTGSKAVMINPVLSPSALLPQFIGVTANYETGQPYDWQPHHCEQYQRFEQELAASQQVLNRTVLLDMADELLDSAATALNYQGIAQVLRFEGGSHGFEHMREALPDIERVIYD